MAHKPGVANPAIEALISAGFNPNCDWWVGSDDVLDVVDNYLNKPNHYDIRVPARVYILGPRMVGMDDAHYIQMTQEDPLIIKRSPVCGNPKCEWCRGIRT